MNLRPIPLLTALMLTGVPALGAPSKEPKPPPPLTVESLLAQAHAAVGKGDTELAVRLAQSAIVADPARPGSYVALGDIYADTGQAEYARSFYDAALDIDPSQPDALKAVAALDRAHPENSANATK
jgi:cytochrome c-type biogenesis protein CcmH/NrfG